MMSCASGNSRRLSIKFMCVTLPYMSIWSGFVSAPDPPLAGCVKSQAAEKEFCAAAKPP